MYKYLVSAMNGNGEVSDIYFEEEAEAIAAAEQYWSDLTTEEQESLLANGGWLDVNYVDTAEGFAQDGEDIPYKVIRDIWYLQDYIREKEVSDLNYEKISADEFMKLRASAMINSCEDLGGHDTMEGIEVFSLGMVNGSSIEVCVDREELAPILVKELRKMRGLTQEEFSRRYHIPKRSIENWENGQRIPPWYVLEMLDKIVSLDLR